ncbi:prohibitin family protein [Hydrogenothermus marinus]|uniref:SPFH domain-containing protein n=1 Tax=Hydrogenothermus marinus TaxID=133270 RepID=A0A3M0BJF0_9AQUI|nr:prohibitin family protein [Hydrogenothermus marinus]RMA97297.1 SPFH domain-containing protein [Hydrogenothermus marinus]
MDNFSKDKININSAVAALPIAIIVIAIFFFLFPPFKTIESGNVGIKITLGKYDNEELKPGLHFKIPLVQEIKVVDVRVHTINYKGNQDRPDKEGLIEKPAINVLDARGLPVRIEMTVQYRIIPDQASELIQEWGWNWEDKMINPTIRDIVRDVIGQYPAEQLPIKRQEIGTKIEQGIEKSIKEVSHNKVEVVGVQLRDIKLPPRIAQKIEEVQIAKQEAEKMKYVEEKAKKQQEIKRIEAETKKIQKVIAAEAEAEKKIKEAEGIAKANKLISQSIDKNVLKWRELEIQEKLMEALKENKNNNIFLNTPAGNMHYWLNTPKK